MPFLSRLLAAMALMTAFPVHALTFEPATPVVAVGETLTLSIFHLGRGDADPPWRRPGPAGYDGELDTVRSVSPMSMRWTLR